MSAEQRRHLDILPLFPSEMEASLQAALLRMFSADERLRLTARKTELPPVVQPEGTQPFGFYTDLQEYAQDLKYYGAKEARTRLHARLYSALATMDQEARRTLTTHPIPMHFVRTDTRSSHFSWRAIGRRKNWKTELSERNAEKPDGDEKERFTLEINAMIAAFETLLAPLEAVHPATFELLSEPEKIKFLKDELGYTERHVEITRHMTLLFPALADQYGKKIDAIVSPNVLHAYTPSPFHLESQSSFLYLKNIAYIPSLGFVGLDQGLMSGYLKEDQEYILQQLADIDVKDWSEEQLMMTIFTLKPELATLPAEEVFAYIKTIVPFKPLEIAEHVNEKNCTYKEYKNYIQVLQSMFDAELNFLAKHPDYANTAQERNEVFSRYIAFALGLKDKLPRRKMIAKYRSILDNKDLALNPTENIQLIDTSFARIYRNLFNVPLRLEQMIECNAIGSIQALGKFNTDNVKNILGGRNILTGNISMDLKNVILTLRENDDISADEARAYAQMYNINPNWIGDVIKYYPGKISCAGYKAGAHQAHWVGQCGSHTMCLACNMQYNLDHGLVNESMLRTNAGSTAEQDEGIQLISTGTMNLSAFITGLANPKLTFETYLIKILLESKMGADTQLPLAA
jgi:hypothetical protein